MITYTPTDKPPAENNTRKHIIIGLVAVLITYFIGYTSGGGDQIHARGTQTHQLNETATLNNGTTLRVLDAREDGQLFGQVAAITIQYNAGPDGHHPTGQPPTLTLSGGETLTPADGIFTLTDPMLDEPLANGLQKNVTLGYDIPIQELTNAQLNIDGALFAGDFTRRINNG